MIGRGAVVFALMCLVAGIAADRCAGITDCAACLHNQECGWYMNPDKRVVDRWSSEPTSDAVPVGLCMKTEHASRPAASRPEFTYKDSMLGMTRRPLGGWWSKSIRDYDAQMSCKNFKRTVSKLHSMPATARCYAEMVDPIRCEAMFGEYAAAKRLFLQTVDIANGVLLHEPSEIPAAQAPIVWTSLEEARLARVAISSIVRHENYYSNYAKTAAKMSKDIGAALKKYKDLATLLLSPPGQLTYEQTAEAGEQLSRFRTAILDFSLFMSGTVKRTYERLVDSPPIQLPSGEMYQYPPKDAMETYKFTYTELEASNKQFSAWLKIMEANFRLYSFRGEKPSFRGAGAGAAGRDSRYHPGMRQEQWQRYKEHQEYNRGGAPPRGGPSGGNGYRGAGGGAGYRGGAAAAPVREPELMDYYKVLELASGVTPVVYPPTEDEVKKMYRKAAMKWHVDKHTRSLSNADEDVDPATSLTPFKMCEEVFKFITGAHKCLTQTPAGEAVPGKVVWDRCRKYSAAGDAATSADRCFAGLTRPYLNDCQSIPKAQFGVYLAKIQAITDAPTDATA